jgi:phosphatidylinositol alpha-1,6-mannosyltransferase
MRRPIRRGNGPLNRAAVKRSIPAHAPRVCVLAGSPFERGGIERLTWEIVQALRATLGSDEVTLAALVGPRREDPRRQNVAFAGSSVLTLRSKVRFTEWVLSRSLHWGSGTLLFFMHVNQAPVGLAARTLNGTRFVVWAHGNEVWGKMQPFSRAAVRFADTVFCSSEFTRDRVVRAQGVSTGRTFTLYPPVSNALLQRAARVRQTAGQAGPVILSVGRVERGYEYKGFDNVIRALPQVAARVPGVRYVVIGGGSGIDDLRELAAHVDVAAQVEFRGEMPDAELWDAFEGARVFAMPSRLIAERGVHWGEGFGIVYAEAAAFARPIVGSVAAGAAEAVVDGVTGRTVDPADVRAIADALLEYLEHPDRAERIGTSGRTRALDRFTPASFARDLAERLPWRRVSPA